MDDMAAAWRMLSGRDLDPEILANLVATIGCWSTGRLATGLEHKGPPIIVSWQKLEDAVYVTMR